MSLSRSKGCVRHWAGWAYHCATTEGDSFRFPTVAALSFAQCEDNKVHDAQVAGCESVERCEWQHCSFGVLAAAVDPIIVLLFEQ